jgi:D-alanyl-lipoteichoic acid acyltransferase DltB (MBOAT superfamily)
MFTKVVIADNCAAAANAVFNNPGFSGSTLVVGAMFFSLQVYGDFSGYSNIAIGTAKLLGFDLMQNFAYPYFSRDIAEFWRRWHISLSTWFRDYVYIPLGGSRCGKWMAVRNVFVIFLISGLWHGANWTYVTWGAVHAALFLPLLLTNRNRIHTKNVAADRNLPSARELAGMLTTFSMVTFAWIFFRCESLSQALSYISQIFTPELLSVPKVLPADTVALVVVFLAVEWIGRHQPYAISQMGFRWPRPVRLTLYYALCLIIIAGGGDQEAFIYFQF